MEQPAVAFRHRIPTHGRQSGGFFDPGRCVQAPSRLKTMPYCSISCRSGDLRKEDFGADTGFQRNGRPKLLSVKNDVFVQQDPKLAPNVLRPARDAQQFFKLVDFSG